MSRRVHAESPDISILDVVYHQHSAPSRAKRIFAALAVAFTVHGALLFFGTLVDAPLVSWGAATAAMIHEELTRPQIELSDPPPLPPAPEPVVAQRAMAPAPAKAPAPAPAQAADIVAAKPTEQAPADFSDETFVTGNAAYFAGGTTQTHGTNTNAVESPVVAPDGSATVSLAEDAWNCPWPKEAEAAHIDEQTAVIRVWVREDGRVETVHIVDDPGFGFGTAAAQCARSTRFTPARDASGKTIAAESPPIRVRFTR